MNPPSRSTPANWVDWGIAAIARPLGLLLVGGVVVVILLAVVWLVFSPFRSVPP